MLNRLKATRLPALAAAGLVLFVASPGSATRAQEITPLAKKLNESFGDPDVQQWIDRFETDGREFYAQRHAVLDLMNLKPGTDVADIGAGTGFFSRLMAEKVSPGGTVYAVDISPAFINHVERRSKELGIANIEAVLGDARSPKLAEDSVDVVFIAHSYHHFEFPNEMLAEIRKALRPDGLFLLIDVERIKGVTPEFQWNMVRAGKGTFTDEIIDAGFRLEKEIDLFEKDYVLQFRLRQEH